MRSCGRVRRSCKDTPQRSPVEVVGVPLGILPSIPPIPPPLLLPDAALLTAAHIQDVSCPMWPWDHTGCEIVPSGCLAGIPFTHLAPNIGRDLRRHRNEEPARPTNPSRARCATKSAPADFTQRS